MIDVVIVGGGAAGISCALTLSSVEDKFPCAKKKRYMVIDDDNSDIKKAKFYNAAGVSFGIEGVKLIEELKKQLANYKSCQFIKDRVVKIEGELNNFTISTLNQNFKAKIVVLATGMHEFSIENKDVEVLPHNKVLKPNKIKLKNTNLKIKDGLYVAGLASGNKTMYAIACGEGARVACDIFEEWTGKFAVAHDSMKN